MDTDGAEMRCARLSKKRRWVVFEVPSPAGLFPKESLAGCQAAPMPCYGVLVIPDCPRLFIVAAEYLNDLRVVHFEQASLCLCGGAFAEHSWVKITKKS